MKLGELGYPEEEIKELVPADAQVIIENKYSMNQYVVYKEKKIEEERIAEELRLIELENKRKGHTFKIKNHFIS